MELRRRLANAQIGDRFHIFERISHQFLRVLLQNASAYAGMVDSTWQPAGWTVACEALASGLPVVLYEGIVSRELQDIGAMESWTRVVSFRNVEQFNQELQTFLRTPKNRDLSLQIINFAKTSLDCEVTAPRFVSAIEEAVSS
jgi:glycosyltransferase involved in cell wall biosynthesis